MTTLDHRTLYRLPWSASDNVLSWLEPTNKCNLSCEGCYRENDGTHKTLSEVQADLDVFNRWRTYDSVSIAGGDPLLHPDIVEIVRMVVRDGHKPILNTNGVALTRGLLEDLKRAGLVGLTFHVDSHLGRAGQWRKKGELELNALRL
ncbi:MAG: radical SAM protein, partial [Myxococcales bacterium]|nr:radical SAM protein [Myxococcales bacterium]